MSQYMFVMCPRGVRPSEAREIINASCTCQIKNACRGGFFVKVEAGKLESIKEKQYEQGTFNIEPARAVNNENWETIRQPSFLRRRQDGDDTEAKPKREYKPREGEVVKERKPREERPKREFKPKEERAPRTERAPREERPKREYKPKEGEVVREKREYKPREDRPKREPLSREFFRAFCLAENYAEVEKYFKETLKTNIVKMETFEDKKHAFLCFKNIEDCRAARAAFREQPIEKVVVRPFMTRRNFAKKPE
ncbi:Conserved_hypothetical protein [Hexamita inflata]|uniref:Uncharacterized protein n=1 Tax=Hexamita inflata TaxID=28002 RepID=A0AA86PYP8_9EUKA|nr:Conserved hypothetical protein [Hexamita inflata]